MRVSVKVCECVQRYHAESSKLAGSTQIFLLRSNKMIQFPIRLLTCLLPSYLILWKGLWYKIENTLYVYTELTKSFGPIWSNRARFWLRKALWTRDGIADYQFSKVRRSGISFKRTVPKVLTENKFHRTFLISRRRELEWVWECVSVWVRWFVWVWKVKNWSNAFR